LSRCVVFCPAHVCTLQTFTTTPFARLECFAFVCVPDVCLIRMSSDQCVETRRRMVWCV
jgi:hypothetical protein